MTSVFLFGCLPKFSGLDGQNGMVYIVASASDEKIDLVKSRAGHGRDEIA